MVPHLTVGRYRDWARRNGLSDYRTLAGLDTFYSGNGIVLRYRRSAPDEPVGGPSCLTYKCRQSPNDIRERTELDLFLDGTRVSDDVVEEFVKVLGLKESFTIKKESWICRLQVMSPEGHYTVVAALYDVLAGGTITRYLEVEIDKDGNIDDSAARIILNGWIGNLQNSLRVGLPLNCSLYELFAPRDELYLPGTF